MPSYNATSRVETTFWDLTPTQVVLALESIGFRLDEDNSNTIPHLNQIYVLGSFYIEIHADFTKPNDQQIIDQRYYLLPPRNDFVEELSLFAQIALNFHKSLNK